MGHRSWLQGRGLIQGPKHRQQSGNSASEADELQVVTIGGAKHSRTPCQFQQETLSPREVEEDENPVDDGDDSSEVVGGQAGLINCQLTITVRIARFVSVDFSFSQSLLICL